MADYVVNLERLMAVNITVDVDGPENAVEAAKAALEVGEVDWDSAHIDQTAAACLATGRADFTVIEQKNVAE